MKKSSTSTPLYSPNSLRSHVGLSRSLSPGEWICDHCHVIYHVIDEQPSIRIETDRIDVTVFGQPQNYIVRKYTLLACSACS